MLKLKKEVNDLRNNLQENGTGAEGEQLRREIETKLKEYYDSISAHQLCQIKAGLVAHEAYTNHSGPFHVVQWLQMRERQNSSIAKRQVVMGSVVQQAGFRLLHLHELLVLGASVGEAMYAVVKYGMRIAEMLMGDEDSEYSGKVIQSATTTASQARFFKRLKANDEVKIVIKPNFLQALNLDITLLEAKKSTRPYYDKPFALMRLLKEEKFHRDHGGNREPAEAELSNINQGHLQAMLYSDINTWLEIASETIVAAYASRLFTKHCLWGAQPSQVPVMDQRDISIDAAVWENLGKVAGGQ